MSICQKSPSVHFQAFPGVRPWGPTGAHLESPGSSFWVPRELSRRPGSLAEASHFFINLRLPPEIDPDRSLEGPRRAQGVPQAPPAQHFESILDRFSRWMSTLAISEIS